MHQFFVNLLFIGVSLLTLCIVITVIAHIFIPVPFIPTPKKILRQLFAFAKIEDGEHVMDLGAGDARILIEAKKQFPSVQATGVEYVPTVWGLGKIRIWLSRQDVDLQLGDALKTDVSNVDCIILYLIPSLMAKLEKKFDEELKPGTRVISYAFAFPTKQPVNEEDVPWLTGERKLRMYVW